MKTLQKGFTLVELSIVLIIISLLVAGVMGAQHMIKAAQLTAVTGDIRKFSAAMDSFEERYGALPGDLSDIAVLPAVTPTPVAGNGNGSIDSTQESVQFWYQLMAAELLPGGFDGSSSFVPARGGSKGGVPAGNIDQSGYWITTNDMLGLVITFSRFSTTSNLIPVLTPAEAYGLDQRLDDGNPFTGNVRAIAGEGAAAQSCTVTTGYAPPTDTPTCIMQFIITPKATTSSAVSSINCNGSPAGMTRVSSTAACPAGYVGNVIEACMVENNVGVWRNVQYLCHLATCGTGSAPGDTQILSCPVAYTGTITETCQSTGINSYVTACNNAPPGTNGVCTEGQVRSFSCPLGLVGVISQRCISNSWVELSTNSCNYFTCSGTTVGTITSSASCPSTYSSGSVTMACTLLGPQAVNNSCTPSYGSCSAGSTRDIGCPAGSMGAHWQKCNAAGYYETDNSPGKGNSCVISNCGGYPVGAVRPAPHLSCSSGTIGVMMEVCDSTGAWRASSNNCGQIKCDMLSDNPTRTNWNSVNAGAQNVAAVSCQTGYGHAPNALRNCDATGTWGAIRGSCVLNCPAGTAGNAMWAEVEANTTSYVGGPGNYCATGYVAGSAVSRACIGNGSGWGSLTGSCVAGVIVQGVTFW